MKTFALAGLVLAAFPLAVSADVTKEEIKKLHAAGVSDEIILSFVQSNGPMAKLSPEDVVELKKLGVSDKLLEGLLVASRVSRKPPQVAPDSQSAPRTTYVYRYTPSYGYSYYDYPYYSSYYYPYSYYSYPYYYYGHHQGHHYSAGHHGAHHWGGHHGGVHHGGHHSGGHHGGGHH